MWESVRQLVEYYDGPRIGIADFRGRPHRFVALSWGPEGPETGWTPDEDRFELTPVEEPDAEPVIARATFQAVDGAPKAGPGVDPTLEVCWHPLEGKDLP